MYILVFAQVKSSHGNSWLTIRQHSIKESTDWHELFCEAGCLNLWESRVQKPWGGDHVICWRACAVLKMNRRQIKEQWFYYYFFFPLWLAWMFGSTLWGCFTLLLRIIIVCMILLLMKRRKNLTLGSWAQVNALWFVLLLDWEGSWLDWWWEHA